MAGASLANGTNVFQYNGNDGPNQKWRFIPIVGGTPMTTVAAGRYYIQNMNSGLYLYPENDGTANNTPVEQGGVIGLTASHQWDLTNVGGGLWRIASVSSNRSLEIAGASTSNNIALQLYDYSGATHQKFYIEAAAGNNYTYAWNNGLGAGADKTVNPSNTTTYTVTATDFEGCSASDAMVVTINSLPSVSALTNQTICTGGTAILTVSVSGGSGTMSYQWQESANNSAWSNVVGGSGATSLSYTTAVLAANKYYRIIVTNSPSTCSATSTSALITVVADPTISVTTTAAIVCNGGAVTLNATPNGGTGSCAIQWQSSPILTTNWANIVGETNATYTPSNLSTGLRYRAQITCSGNGCCN